jgi:hypothetical protein
VGSDCTSARSPRPGRVVFRTCADAAAGWVSGNSTRAATSAEPASVADSPKGAAKPHTS